MKHLIAALLLLAAASSSSNAQFRSEVDQAQPPLNTVGAMKGGDSFLSSLLDPNRFSMHQSVSMSYESSPFGSVGLDMFTNTFSYRASDNLFVSADVSAVYSPFSSFGSAFQNQLNGIYLTSARLDWKLSDNAFMRVEYDGGPAAGMYGGYNPYYNPFFTASPFAASPTGVRAASAQVQLH